MDIWFFTGFGKSGKVCNIRIVNTGFVKAKITGLGWKNVPFCKYEGYQLPNKSKYDSAMPVELNHGEETTYIFPFYSPIEGGDDWINLGPSNMLKKPLWLSSLTLRLRVHTSIGKIFTIRPNKPLRRELVKSAKENM